MERGGDDTSVLQGRMMTMVVEMGVPEKCGGSVAMHLQCTPKSSRALKHTAFVICD